LPPTLAVTTRQFQTTFACTSAHLCRTCSHARTPAGPARAAAGRRWPAVCCVQAPAAGAARAAPHHLPDGRVHGRAGPRRAGEDRFCRCVCARCMLPARRMSSGACAAAHQPLHQRRSGQAGQPGGRGRCRPGALALLGGPRASCCDCTLYTRTAELLQAARAARCEGAFTRDLGAQDADRGKWVRIRARGSGRAAAAEGGAPGRSLAAYLALPVDEYSLLDPEWVERCALRACKQHARAATALRPALTRVGACRDADVPDTFRVTVPLREVGTASRLPCPGRQALLTRWPCSAAERPALRRREGSAVVSQAACIPCAIARQSAALLMRRQPPGHSGPAQQPPESGASADARRAPALGRGPRAVRAGHRGGRPGDRPRRLHRRPRLPGRP